MGGVAVDHLSWRLAFFPSVLLAIITLVVIRRNLTDPQVTGGIGVDWLGAALLALGLAAVLLVATWAGREHAWHSPVIVSTMAVGVSALLWFVRQERRAPSPILPLYLFRNREFSAANATSFIAGFGLFLPLAYFPVFLQISLGMSATHSGLLLVPMLTASLVASLVSGCVVARWGRYRSVVTAGCVLLGVGLTLMSTMTVSTSSQVAAVYLLVFGLSMGILIPVLVLVIQNAVHPRDLGVATSSVQVFRQLGGSTGVAVFGALFNARAPRVGAHGSHAKGMVSRNRALPVEGGHHGDGEAFRQGHQLASGLGGSDATACHEHRPLGAIEQVQSRSHVLRVGEGPHRRHGGESCVHGGVEVGPFAVDLAFVADELEVYRSRTARHRRTEGLANQIGNLFHRVDDGAELGDVDEGGEVVHLLVDAVVGCVRVATTGKGHDGRVGQVRVSEAGGQVECPHRLGHAHSRAACHPGVTVGHVRGRLLAVGVDAPHAEPLELHERTPQDGRHHEDVRDAVPVEHFGENAGTGNHRGDVSGSGSAPAVGCAYRPGADRVFMTEAGRVTGIPYQRRQSSSMCGFMRSASSRRRCASGVGL